jgi:hypothetical protein
VGGDRPGKALEVLPAGQDERHDGRLVRFGERLEQDLVGPGYVRLRGDVEGRLEVDRVDGLDVHERHDVERPGAGRLELLELLIFENDIASVDRIPAKELVPLDHPNSQVGQYQCCRIRVWHSAWRRFALMPSGRAAT